ncbi:MAG: hypothetical protein ACYDCK_06230 [Thermoplasmatota archaeon]
MRVIRLAVLLALALIACAGPSSAQSAPVEAHATALSVIEVHPFPDPGRSDGTGGDPFGVEWANGDDRMYETYGATWFPTARFDGVIDSSFARDASVSNPREFYDEYRGDIEQRLAKPPLYAIQLDLAPNLTASAVFTPLASVGSRDLDFVAALFQDDVHYDGGNGVLQHRFVVLAWQDVHRAVSGNASVALAFPFNTSSRVNASTVGVIAFVQNLDTSATGLEPFEVLNSATHFLRDATPTVQTSRSVLLELYTATWCKSCVFGDGAADELASQFGVASVAESAAGSKYWRSPSASDVVFAVAGVAVFGLALVPRRNA